MENIYTNLLFENQLVEETNGSVIDNLFCCLGLKIFVCLNQVFIILAVLCRNVVRVVGLIFAA